jgi:RNA polymerase sigma-70 factor, ECF subfamily
MTHDESFRSLMARLRSGEDAAAQRVFERFARQLIGLTRRQFDQRLAHKVDPEDVVQSAYKSFFVRHQAGQLTVENWNSLWKLLTIITLRKCADRVEYHKAARRDAAREARAPADPDRPAPWQETFDRAPLPEEAAILAETLEGLYASMDADERPILELSLQGYTVPEISDRLGRAERSVRRLRERIRKRLERMQGVQ